MGRPRREHILRRVPRGGVCAEIGVFRGWFTQHILAIARPSQVHLIDAWWTLYGERFPDWGAYTEHGQLTTRKAYDEVRQIVRDAGDLTTIQIHVGDATTVLESFPDHYFDWVYLDTTHEYERTRRELAVLEFKLKPAGFVLGDDWHENPSHIHAGVAVAARELCATDRWELLIPGDRFGQWMIQSARSTHYTRK
jgi:hypothetical protein